MDTESLVNAFYGTPEAPPTPDATLLSGGDTTEKPAQLEEQPAASPVPDESAVDMADILYGPGEGQVPEGGHYPEVDELYGGIENEDRVNGEEVNSEEFHASNQGLQQFAADAGLGRSHIRTLMDAAREAMDNPISSHESLEARNNSCLAELRQAWGGRFDENLKLAEAEANRLTAMVPYAHEVLVAGAGSNPALIKILADAGRARARRK
tara:strand:+ start:5320 stop:5949 length:630 start_codon:yes stop_codon:yes gene_type:complete